MAESCKEQFTQGKYEQLFTDLLQKLPSNQYFWKYGFAERHKFKPELDKIVDLFMETDGKETMDEILPRLQKFLMITKKRMEIQGTNQLILISSFTVKVDYIHELET